MQKAGIRRPVYSFGASSILARQIGQGTPAALFASADEEWKDRLAKRKSLCPDTRRGLRFNKLVLIVPASHAQQVTMGPNFYFAALLGLNRPLATCDLAHVAVGLYAKPVLQEYGGWNSAGRPWRPQPVFTMRR